MSRTQSRAQSAERQSMAAGRQAQKEKELAAWRSATTGGLISLEWRVISPADIPNDDEGWVLWSGGVIRAVDGPNGTVDWPAGLTDFQDGGPREWPLRPAVEPGCIFEVRNIRVQRKRLRAEFSNPAPTTHNGPTNHNPVETSNPPTAGMLNSFPQPSNTPWYAQTQNQPTFVQSTQPPQQPNIPQTGWTMHPGVNPTAPQHSFQSPLYQQGPIPTVARSAHMPLSFTPGLTDVNSFTSDIREAQENTQRIMLAPALSVPRLVTDRFRPYYPHIWAAMATHTQKETILVMWESTYNSPSGIVGRGRLPTIGRLVADNVITAWKQWFLLTDLAHLSTRDDWIIPMKLLYALLLQSLWAIYDPTEMTLFASNVDANPTIVDFAKAARGLKTQRF